MVVGVAAFLVVAGIGKQSCQTRVVRYIQFSIGLQQVVVKVFRRMARIKAIRRCHRYGQTRRVHAHVVLSELEGQIAENVARKEKQATETTEELVREMRVAGELRMS